MGNDRPVYVVVGTRAQFIKTAPVLRAMLDEGIKYHLIYTSQHRENISEILDLYGLRKPDKVMCGGAEANTRKKFFSWFLCMLVQVLINRYRYIPEPGILLTHGDTFTTWLAALLGKRTGCIVGHLESGCRSFNLFSPFPEEISRLITFRLSDIYFCADQWAADNLKKYPGKKIIMGANTMLDGVRFALNRTKSHTYPFEQEPFALVSIHRYENIYKPRFNNEIIPLLENIAKEHQLIITLHPTTRERLHSLGLYEKLNSNPKIILHERFGFVDWIHLCNTAEFVITDGGSNQEELSYLGVPTILFRTETERKEGLDQNVVVSKFSEKIIYEFIKNYRDYKQKSKISLVQPSGSIINEIRKNT